MARLTPLLKVLGRGPQLTLDLNAVQISGSATFEISPKIPPFSKHGTEKWINGHQTCVEVNKRTLGNLWLIYTGEMSMGPTSTPAKYWRLSSSSLSWRRGSRECRRNNDQGEACAAVSGKLERFCGEKTGNWTFEPNTIVQEIVQWLMQKNLSSLSFCFLFLAGMQPFSFKDHSLFARSVGFVSRIWVTSSRSSFRKDALLEVQNKHENSFVIWTIVFPSLAKFFWTRESRTNWSKF